MEQYVEIKYEGNLYFIRPELISDLFNITSNFDKELRLMQYSEYAFDTTTKKVLKCRHAEKGVAQFLINAGIRLANLT